MDKWIDGVVKCLSDALLFKPHRCSLFRKWLFHKSYSQAGCGLSGLVLEAPPYERTVLLESLKVLGFVIGRAVLPHSPQYFEPALAQATQSAGMVMALVPFGLIISLGPITLFAALVNPQMDGMAQKVITDITDAGLVNPAGLIGDGADAGLAHQTVGIGKDLAPGADQAQQSRRKGLFG